MGLQEVMGLLLEPVQVEEVMVLDVVEEVDVDEVVAGTWCC